MNNGAADFIDEVFCPGAAFLPGGYRLLSAGEVVERYEMHIEILEGLGDEEMVGWLWHPAWVPFAEHVSADVLAIDLRAGPGRGAVGESYNDSGTTFDWGPCLAAVIERFAVSVETGSGFGHYWPQVVDGCLEWDVVVSPGE